MSSSFVAVRRRTRRFVEMIQCFVRRISRRLASAATTVKYARECRTTCGYPASEWFKNMFCHVFRPRPFVSTAERVLVTLRVVLDIRLAVQNDDDCLNYRSGSNLNIRRILTRPSSSLFLLHNGSAPSAVRGPAAHSGSRFPRTNEHFLGTTHRPQTVALRDRSASRKRPR